MEEEIILKKKYSIPYEMFEKAFDTFQKKYVYPRNMMMSAVLLIAAIANVVNILKGNSSNISYVLVLACIALAFVNWYNPRKLKKNLMVSIKGIENDVYRLVLMPDKLKIGTVLDNPDENNRAKAEYEEVFEDTPAPENIEDTEIYLTNGVDVIEKPEFFMVYIKKAMFYVIPKKDFYEEEITVMQLHFQKQLGKNYRRYEK